MCNVHIFTGKYLQLADMPQTSANVMNVGADIHAKRGFPRNPNNVLPGSSTGCAILDCAIDPKP